MQAGIPHKMTYPRPVGISPNLILLSRFYGYADYAVSFTALCNATLLNERKRPAAESYLRKCADLKGGKTIVSTQGAVS